MIVLLSPRAGERELDELLACLRRMGLEGHVAGDAECTVAAVAGGGGRRGAGRV